MQKWEIDLYRVVQALPLHAFFLYLDLFYLLIRDLQVMIVSTLFFFFLTFRCPGPLIFHCHNFVEGHFIVYHLYRPRVTQFPFVLPFLHKESSNESNIGQINSSLISAPKQVIEDKYWVINPLVGDDIKIPNFIEMTNSRQNIRNRDLPKDQCQQCKILRLHGVLELNSPLEYGSNHLLFR